MSILDKNITLFKKLTAKNGESVNLLEWLEDDSHKAEIERIRSLDPEAYKKAKKCLPAITPSGTFENRVESGLIEHSGLIQFDIDHLEDVNSLKSALSEIPFIAYCGLSTSGRGLWGLIPIAYPEQHKGHFRALKAAFSDMGVVIDSKPQNVASLRFVSYDPEPYVNHQAEPFPYLSELPEVSKATLAEPEKILSCIEQIERNQIDITGGYETWFPIGTAFIQYGEQGRQWFHQISRFSHLYDSGELDQYWKTWVKAGASADIGTFFNACKDHGILYAPAKNDEAPAEGTAEHGEMIREEQQQQQTAR